MSFWNAVITTVPASPASTPRPSIVAVDGVSFSCMIVPLGLLRMWRLGPAVGGRAGALVHSAAVGSRCRGRYSWAGFSRAAPGRRGAQVVNEDDGPLLRHCLVP